MTTTVTYHFCLSNQFLCSYFGLGWVCKSFAFGGMGQSYFAFPVAQPAEAIYSSVDLSELTTFTDLQWFQMFAKTMNADKLGSSELSEETFKLL